MRLLEIEILTLVELAKHAQLSKLRKRNSEKKKINAPKNKELHLIWSGKLIEKLLRSPKNVPKVVVQPKFIMGREENYLPQKVR